MIFRKTMLLVGLVLLTACSAKKNVVRTSNDSRSKEVVVRKVKKPVIKTPENKTVATNQSESASKTEVLEATTTVKVTTAIVLEYIEKYRAIAQEDMIKYGIPASITLGQGILESGAGTGPLSRQANNHFGIKCHSEWTGDSVKHDDDAAQECFRKYNKPEESYRDHSVFLTTRKYYIPLFKLPKDDYKAWAKGLKDCGYATDKAYATKLIALIERYQLQRFDAEVLGMQYEPVKTELILTQNNPLTINAEQHIVVKGDTLYSISKRYNISIEDLKKKNHIIDNTISLGQSLQIK